MSKTAKREFGDWGEDMAAQFLKKMSYEIVERNYRAKHSDLDIIAWQRKRRPGQTLCFIEVKTRTGEAGTAEAATNPEKKKNIFFAARHYCLEHNLSINRTPIQFEQVSIYVDPAGAVSYKHDVIPVD